MIGKKIQIKDEEKDSHYEAVVRDKLSGDRYLVEVTDDGGMEGDYNKGDAKIISAKTIVGFLSLVILLSCFFLNQN